MKRNEEILLPISQKYHMRSQSNLRSGAKIIHNLRHTIDNSIPSLTGSSSKNLDTPINFTDTVSFLPVISPRKNNATPQKIKITPKISTNNSNKNKDFSEFLDNFTKMYANLQYSILTINSPKKHKEKINNNFSLENDLHKLCSKPIKNQGNFSSIDKACVLVQNLRNIKVHKNYQINHNEFGEIDIKISDFSEPETDHMENTRIMNIQIFLKQNAEIPSMLKGPPAVYSDEKSLIPHFSHHIGHNRNQFVEETFLRSNISQRNSEIYSIDQNDYNKVFRNKERKNPSKYQDLIDITKIKRFAFWQILLLRGNLPKQFKGFLFSDFNYSKNEFPYFIIIQILQMKMSKNI